MGTKAPQFDGSQGLSQEVQAQISAVVARAVEKIDPELQEIAKILKVNGIQGGIQFGMSPMPFGIPSPLNAEFGGFPFPHPPMPASSVTPDNDLVGGIKKILDTSFGDVAEPILGMMYDPHYSVALDIAKIMDAARKRDRESLARELDAISVKIKKL